MQPHVLVQFARFKPLAGWSLSASILGASLAYYIGKGQILAPLDMIVAAICVVMIQYVAHPMNDIMDLEVDRHAPIEGTGRHKPLVDGSITVREAKRLSAIIVVAVVVMMGYLITIHPVLVLPAIYGLVALFGYNHSLIRWAYRPFTELYLGVPINFISVLVISFIGSGLVTVFSVSVGLIFGFSSGAFFVSMMSMDYLADKANGKVTTVVKWPRSRYCTIFPLLGLAVLLVTSPALLSEAPGVAVLLLGGGGLIILSYYGAQADDLRLDYLSGQGPLFQEGSGHLRLKQLYISLVLSMAMSVILLWGGLP